MTKHTCDDCGDDLYARWWNGDRFGLPDLELCQRCYRRRVEAKAEPETTDTKDQR